MAKKSSPQPPPAPDPSAVARAQTGSNLVAAIGNTFMGNANEYSPLGTVENIWAGERAVVDPSNGNTYYVPTFDRRTTLSPEQQRLYDQQTGLGIQSNDIAKAQLTRVNDMISSPIDQSRLPARVDSIEPRPTLSPMAGRPSLYEDLAPVNIESFDGGDYQELTRNPAEVGGPQRNVGPIDYSNDRRRVEEAIYSRINPQLDRDRAALETTLVNQGFTRGSEAFNREMDSFGRQANDARMQAVLAGGQEQSRMAGLDFQRFGLENQAQAQDNAQRIERAGFANDASTQDLQNRIAQNTATNVAAGLEFDQDAQRRSFYNTSRQQDYDNEARRIEFNNRIYQQDFANRQDDAAFRNTARERALQETFALRNQPLNEIAALMGGGQVTMPQFTQFRPGQIEAAQPGMYAMQGYQTSMQGYNAQQQAQAQSRAGLYNLGASILGAGTRMAAPRLF